LRRRKGGGGEYIGRSKKSSYILCAQRARGAETYTSLKRGVAIGSKAAWAGLEEHKQLFKKHAFEEGRRLGRILAESTNILFDASGEAARAPRARRFEKEKEEAR